MSPFQASLMSNLRNITPEGDKSEGNASPLSVSEKPGAHRSPYQENSKIHP